MARLQAGGRRGGHGGWSEGLLCLALAIGLLGCGGSGKKAATPPAPTTSAATTSAPTSVTAAASTPSTAAAAGTAQAIITKNWTAFFDAKTPTARRVALLQDGRQFASIIGSQAGSGLASTVTAKVKAVVLDGATQAKVTYSILLAGSTVLANQPGVAVLQDGAWKIGDSSFCGLLSLENAGKTSGLPAACAAG